MEPSNLFLVVAALACPIGMGVMIWLMNKQTSGQAGHSMPGNQTPADSAERLVALRNERNQLEAEIAEVARLAELEARREALLARAKSSGRGPDEAGISTTPGAAH